MDETLDVLVMQAEPHTADPAVEALVAAGHRVHRCHDVDATGFPCRGAVDPAACPLDRPLDVALLVRPGIRPEPEVLEAGVTCAIRAQLPIVEQGTDLLDPFAPWVTERVGSPSEVARAVADAAELSWRSLRHAIEMRTAALLRASGIDPSDAVCSIGRGQSTLQIELQLPAAVGLRVEHALAVRVLDAVRSTGRTYGRINVSVTPSVTPDGPVTAV